MASPNLLIGSGETLTSSIPREGGGGSSKAYPYSIEQTRARLAPQLEATLTALRSVPAKAMPRGEAVALVTIHPTFLSKWQMPGDVFEVAGLRSLGSRATSSIPEHDARARIKAGPQLAAQLYVSGTEHGYKKFLSLLLSEETRGGLQLEFRRIEGIRLQVPLDRVLRIPTDISRLPVELVVHGEGDDEVLMSALSAYASECDAHIQTEKRFSVPGLVFIPGTANGTRINELAQFSALRAVRRLPVLRLNRPVMRKRASVDGPELPTDTAISEETRVVVFDGGLGIDDLSRWATETVPVELTKSHADYLTHGTEVTSALLFGAIDVAATHLPRPYFTIEHHRVVGSTDEHDVDLYDCMQRIDKVLARGDIAFANLSLGPRLSIDDDHPHAWTCMLDGHLAKGDCLATVAVGNDGELPDELGRIQPPADAVNALSVGAATSNDFMWDRASYSCRGPGRSPGRVKPDGVYFGGSAAEELFVLSPYSQGLCSVRGTSYAAPLTLRVAAGAAAIAETKLTATALRALMIHRAEAATGHKKDHVGWGRFPSTVDELLTCADNEATVLYQGFLQAGIPLRARLPIPAVPMGTNLSIKATFCFASQVDPADSINYTRHGLTIVFRPQGEGTTGDFFSGSTHSSEAELRADAHKWETVLHQARSWRAESLLDACFDIQHGARARGRKVNNKTVPSLPYVLIVTLASDSAQPVYNNVLQRYQTLQPIRLRARIET